MTYKGAKYPVEFSAEYGQSARSEAEQQQPVVMREYSQGICEDGAAILCDGQMMAIEEILARLRTLENVRAVLYDAPELNPSNYDHDQACQLNTAVCEAWNIIESDA